MAQSLRPLSFDETSSALRAATRRARQRIEAGPEGISQDVRRAMLDANEGFGHLLRPITKSGIGTKRKTRLASVGIRFLWQLCIRKRSELAALQAEGSPLFSERDLDNIEQFLSQFDLSLTPDA